jgi:hypothetical protein
MSSNVIGLLIPAIALIVSVLVLVGLPALAVVAVRYFKLRERELTLEMEFRQKSQHKDLALEQRVQRLEDAFAGLDQDVRLHLGIGRSSTPLQSRPDLAEAPSTEERESREPVRTKTR